MARHILDTPKTRTTSGMKLSFSKILAAELPRRASLALQRRPASRSAGARLREYARIDRGAVA